MSIEFDANSHGMPWRFQPAVRHIEVHPGELVHVEYEVANVRDAPVTGQAVVSYGPALAGGFVIRYGDASNPGPARRLVMRAASRARIGHGGSGGARHRRA